MAQVKDKLDVICFGYNGVNNTGSEAKLLTTLSEVREVFGERLGRVAVLTQNEKEQRRYVNDPSIEMVEIGPSNMFTNDALRKGGYDVLLLSEGSTFIDHFSPLFLAMFCIAGLIARRRGAKIVCYSNDCGHLQPMSQRLLRYSVNKFDYVILRNPDAKARMQQYGVTKPIEVTADGAYLYPTPSRQHMESIWKRYDFQPERRPVIGLACKEFFWWPIKLRPFGPKEDLYNYPFYHSWTREAIRSSQRYIDQMARYADWCVEQYDADIALISMEHMDAPPSIEIRNHMRRPERAKLVLSDDCDVDDIVSVLSILKLQVTTRYHTTVLASPFAVPMISVSSDTRCEAVFREIDMMEYFIDYVTHPETKPKVHNLDTTLIELTEKLVKQEDLMRERLKKTNEDFIQRARKNPQLLKEWVEKTF